MRYFSRFLSLALLFSLTFAPALAQEKSANTNYKGAATSSLFKDGSGGGGQAGAGLGGGGGALLGIGLGIGAGLVGLGLLGAFAVPVATLGTSFGGRIAAVVPCASALGPSLWFTIVPAGAFSVTYIWTPATITYTAGPPRNPGQQVLGLADIPYTCFVGKIPFYGQRIRIIGTSPAI